MSNVIHLVPAPVAVRSRRRAEALGALIPRLKHLRSVTTLCATIGNETYDIAVINDLTCSFHDMADGTYFRVEIAGECSPAMTGYFDNRGRAAQAYGPVHVMSWRRGWEDRLF